MALSRPLGKDMPVAYLFTRPSTPPGSLLTYFNHISIPSPASMWLEASELSLSSDSLVISFPEPHHMLSSLLLWLRPVLIPQLASLSSLDLVLQTEPSSLF